MAEYNSAYTGAQIDGAVGAVIDNKSTWDGAATTASAAKTAAENAQAAADAAQTTADGKEAAGTAASAVSSHNKSASAHSDIRSAVSAAKETADAAKTAAESAQATANGKENAGTAASAVSSHNSSSSSHSDIRTLANNASSAASTAKTTAEAAKTAADEAKAASAISDTTATALGLTGDPTVDDAFARLAKKSEYKVGDIKVTARTDLGDEWALCNGAGVPGDAAELSALLPQNEYPFSTFDVLNLRNYDSVYDVFNSADGKIYVLASQYNESNQIRQCVFQISPSGGVLRKLEIISIPSFASTGNESNSYASSVFVDNSKIYLFGMPAESKVSALPIVVYGEFAGDAFPTIWNTVEIPIPSSYTPLNTYSVSGMGRDGIFRIVDGKYYFLVYCYNDDSSGFAAPFLVSDSLGGTTTAITTGTLNSTTLFVDSDNYLYLAGWNQTFRLMVIKNGELIKTGYLQTSQTLSAPWFICSGNYVYCYTLGTSLLFSLTYEKGSSADMARNSKDIKAKTPVIQWGEKVLAYGVASNSQYPVYQITQLAMETVVATGKSAPASAVPSTFIGSAFHEGDYYISIGGSGDPYNTGILRLIISKSLPTITFDGAYAYIKTKEVTT